MNKSQTSSGHPFRSQYRATADSGMRDWKEGRSVSRIQKCLMKKSVNGSSGGSSRYHCGSGASRSTFCLMLYSCSL